MSNDKLVIFDTTLRDGEQSPGASMTKDEKVRIAKILELCKIESWVSGHPRVLVEDLPPVLQLSPAIIYNFSLVSSIL